MKFFITIILLSTSILAHAQEIQEINTIDNSKHLVGFRFGIGGAGIGDFDFKGKDRIGGLTKKIMPSLTIGMSYEYRLKPYLNLRGEINYISKGGGYEAPNSSVVIITSKGAESGKNYYEYRLGYFEFPLLLKTILGKEKSYSYFIGGFAPSINTGASFQTNHWTNSGSFGVLSTSSVKESVSVHARGFDLPLMIGFGRDLYMKGNFSTSIEVRYSYGLIKAFPSGNNHNNVLNLNLGIIF